MDKLERLILAQRIRDAATKEGLTQAEIGRKAGIDQSQVSRILAGEFQKLSGHALKVCTILNINMTFSTRENERLERAIGLLWDGTETHERAILELLEAAAKLGSR